MAIKLVTEAMDWAPATLTHRQHKVLIILAENARLPSRETWDSVESERILRRAQITPRQMYEVIAALVAKGCLVKPVWGGRNHRAKYKIARLAVPRPGKAAYEAMLARLSPGERQVLIYADWWPDHDHDQHAEKPQTENHDQHARFTETEKPRSACGKTTPDSLLVPADVRLGWKVQTIGRKKRPARSAGPPKAERPIALTPALLLRRKLASEFTTARTSMVLTFTLLWRGTSPEPSCRP